MLMQPWPCHSVRASGQWEIALPSLLHSGPLKAGDDVNAIAFSLNALILLGTGLLLGAAGSGFTIRRFLKV